MIVICACICVGGLHNMLASAVVCAFLDLTMMKGLRLLAGLGCKMPKETEGKVIIINSSNAVASSNRINHWRIAGGLH